MHSIFREYLQGAVGWLTFVTGFVAAVTALLRAFLPLFKEMKKWRRTKDPDGSHPQSSRVKIKSLTLGLALLFFSAVAFDFVTKPQQISVSEERTNAAWDYFKNGEPNPVLRRPAAPENLNRAIEIAETVVSDLTGPANAKELSLSRDGVPLPPTGEVSAEQRRTILAYGPLNDVATCLWIEGRAFQYLNRTNDAIVAYLQLTNYPHARTWDTKGWFWSPTEDALGRLGALTNSTTRR